MPLVYYHGTPIGLEVRGKLGDQIYRVSYKKQQVMELYAPTNPRTEKQEHWRHVVKHYAAVWMSFSVEVKQEWTDAAKATRRKPRWASGYIYYLTLQLRHYVTMTHFTIGTHKIGDEAIA